MSLVMSKVGGKWNKWRKMGEGRVSVMVVKARVPCLQFRLSLGSLLLIIDFTACQTCWYFIKWECKLEDAEGLCE